VQQGQLSLPYTVSLSTLPATWIIGNPDQSLTWEKTNLTLDGSAQPALFIRHYEYEAQGQLDYFVSPQIDFASGSTVYNATISIAFQMREAAKSNALQIIGEGQRYLKAVVLDNNGKYWWVENLQLNGGDETTGTARTEGSKYDVTFLGEMDNRPYQFATAPTFIS
jgi:hypothetical protein